MIYVDMDGVLANLYDYMTERMFQKKFVDLNENQIFVFKKVFKEKLYFNHCFPEGVEAVFENLEPFPFNNALIETVMKFGNEYSILSRPCNLDIEGTKRAKIKWIEKHLSFCPPKDVILVQDKSANGRAKGNVLIDDWDDFLIRWEQKGGYPIKYKAVDYNDADLVKGYLKDKLSHF
jgi:5'(3')-deoxyribonucleotidase